MPSLKQIQKEILNYYRAEPVDSSVLNQAAQDDIGIYKSLVVGGMESFLKKTFKHCHQILDLDWYQISCEYLEQYPSKSPIYYMLAKDFPEFLKNTSLSEYKTPNYISELALVEWTQLEITNCSKDNPYKVLELKFPISKIISLISDSESLQELKESNLEEENENLLIYREEKSNKVKILSLNAASLFVIKASEEDTETLFKSFCSSFNYQEDDSKIQKAFDALIKNFKAIGIWPN